MLTDEDINNIVPLYASQIARSYKEEEHTYNPLISFNLTLYPKSFTHENIIEFTEEDSRIKLGLCKTFTKNYSINVNTKFIYTKSFKSNYFYMFSVRCLLHQPPDMDSCEKLMSNYDILLKLSEFIHG